MRTRLLIVVSLVALAPILSACENFDMDKLDVFNLNEKKKLPGDRRAVFPEGVPGVAQGVPPELMKGYQPPPDPTPEPESNRKPRPRKSRSASRNPRVATGSSADAGDGPTGAAAGPAARWRCAVAGTDAGALI